MTALTQKKLKSILGDAGLDTDTAPYLIDDPYVQAIWKEAQSEQKEHDAGICDKLLSFVDDVWRQKRPDEAAELDAKDNAIRACAAAIRNQQDEDET
jgi:hypothetical protein